MWKIYDFLSFTNKLDYNEKKVIYNFQDENAPKKMGQVIFDNFIDGNIFKINGNKKINNVFTNNFLYLNQTSEIEKDEKKLFLHNFLLSYNDTNEDIAKIIYDYNYASVIGLDKTFKKILNEIKISSNVLDAMIYISILYSIIKSLVSNKENLEKLDGINIFIKDFEYMDFIGNIFDISPHLVNKKGIAGYFFFDLDKIESLVTLSFLGNKNNKNNWNFINYILFPNLYYNNYNYYNMLSGFFLYKNKEMKKIINMSYAKKPISEYSLEDRYNY